MSDSRPGRGADQFIVRFPEGMRERVKDAADKNGRSMNAEIVDLIQSALDDVGPTKHELGEIIERQNQHMADQKQAIAQLSRATEAQRDALEKMHAQLDKDAEFAMSILRRVLDYIDDIPASLTVWADETLQILDLNSDWKESEDEVVFHPDTPEHSEQVAQRVRAARERHSAYISERLAKIVKERRSRVQKKSDED